MNKIFYIANIRLPTERAHGIQIMKMCEALAEAGGEVELIVTDRKSVIKEDPFSYYGVKRNFQIKKFWCLDTAKFGKFGFRLGTLSFALSAFTYLFSKKGVFYTRDEFSAFFLRLLGKKVFWEVHMGQKNLLSKSIIKMGVPLVTISHGLRDLYPEASRVLVAPDAVDARQFGAPSYQKEARERLGLRADGKIVMYAGSRQSWKGVETFEKAEDYLSSDIEMMVVTGKPHQEIPLYLKSADILVIPNTAKEAISKYYTSPMKLFEYMASGVPIISSDLPSTREIVDESNAFFFVPDDSKSLAHVVEYVLSHENEAQERAKKAVLEVKKYTWQGRAERVLRFLKETENDRQD